MHSTTKVLKSQLQWIPVSSQNTNCVKTECMKSFVGIILASQHENISITIVFQRKSIASSINVNLKKVMSKVPEWIIILTPRGTGSLIIFSCNDLSYVTDGHHNVSPSDLFIDSLSQCFHWVDLSMYFCKIKSVHVFHGLIY